MQYAATSRCTLLLVSRRSKHRAGTRFFDRGTDDDGQVANYCETEQIIFGVCAASYVIVPVHIHVCI